MGTRNGFPASLPSVSAPSAGHAPMSSGGSTVGSTRSDLGEARRADVKRVAEAGLSQAGGGEGGGGKAIVGDPKGEMGGEVGGSMAT